MIALMRQIESTLHCKRIGVGVCKCVSVVWMDEICQRLNKGKEMLRQGFNVSKAEEVIKEKVYVPMIEKRWIKAVKSGVYSHTLLNENCVIGKDVVILSEGYQKQLESLRGKMDFSWVPEVTVIEIYGMTKLIREYPVITISVFGIPEAQKVVEVSSIPNEEVESFHKRVSKILKIEKSESTLSFKGRVLTEKDKVCSPVCLNVVNKLTAFSATGSTFGLSIF
ncbi:hypothetical protein EIN_485910 [Entamoeba invadens IP1]|uniref:Uncharacterized protein n=1 Tax=Entamoeba invadens IP1 TaxID=370355 RepID=A0A0A1U4R0_ENTIV|nr:hypothetical protein EIN_485910 [Entamoeba invadens IP1]ELP89189.1 hypothetical protein EIN_485910 [Entamoeba invadens IP1]|eukprot:XP_004255960.1 hypothetical protein EIN_485910 [Entamoeba invadens IP1]